MLDILKDVKIQNTSSCSSGCCSTAEEPIIAAHNHTKKEGDHSERSNISSYLPAIISFVLLLIGMVLEHGLQVGFFNGGGKILWYVIAYLPVGLPVLKESYHAARNGAVFTEFSLMSIATIGAFGIGEYPEGVAVMLFYTIGELFQGAAVRRAKSNIRALLDVRPNTATVWRKGNYVSVEPQMVLVGEKIEVKVGEKIPLDGSLLSENASLNRAALTGESKPQRTLKGEQVLAGSINLEGVIEVEVEKMFHDSSIARIFELVQNASNRKSKTELLIRRLAKVYTPIIAYLAMAICLLPYFFVDNYVFSDWLYRALVFLVISCPCALVISIPLGYFGGLGAASKNGLLFKGATFLDQLPKIDTLVMDKTGTLTKGVFKIKNIVIQSEYAERNFMGLLMAIEAKSTHPIAKAIMEYSFNEPIAEARDVVEIAGKGLQGNVGTKTVLAGNKKMMMEFGIAIPSKIDEIVESMVMVAIDGKFAGYVTIADELKADAKEGIERLRKIGIRHFMVLSGDKSSITQKVAKELGIEEARGDLLPEDKWQAVEEIKKDPRRRVAFVGDGINDAPVLAMSDVGIAMGGLGSDIAIETADVVIQTDQVSKIAMGIQIAKSTQTVIWQNIVLAFGVKGFVLVIGAMGLATMWAAVFADVGVALLAILNAVRLQGMKWN